MFLKNKILILLLLILIGVPFETFAAAPYSADSVVGVVTSAMAPAMSKLLVVAMTWLAAFATIQLVVTNIGLLKSGADIEAIYGKLIGSLMWIGFCIYLVNNGPAFITSVGDSFFGLLGLSMPTAGSIMLKTSATAGIIGVLSLGVNYANGTGGLLLMYFSIFVLAVGMLFAFKIFMLHMELGLVIMLSPLSFSFLGLNALKDQGIAPFKALVSLAYRIILITVILSAFTEVSTVVSDTFKDLGVSDFATSSRIMATLTLVFSALGAYVMLAYLVFKSDSIASSLASGSTNMGTGDVASAAAMGAAAGAAVASGGASLAAANPVKSMSEVMKSMMGGGGGSVSNAGGMGGGGTSALPLTPPSPSASMSNGLSGSPSGSSGPESAAAPSRGTADERGGFDAGKGTDGYSPSASAPGGSGASGADGVASPGSAGTSGSDGVAAANVQATKDFLATNPGTPKTAKEISDFANTLSKPTANSGATAPSAPGSGSTAGIGGAGSATDQKFDKLMDQLAAQQGGGKKTMGDHLKEANSHVAQEKAHTSASINMHHSD